MGKMHTVCWVHSTEQSWGAMGTVQCGWDCGPFPPFPGTGVTGLWFLVSRITASSNPGKERGHLEGTFSQTSQLGKWETLFNGTVPAGQVWLCRIRDFTLEECRLLKAKLYRGFSSPVIKAAASIPPFRGSPSGENSCPAGLDRLHISLQSTLCAGFPFEMN